MWKSAMRHGQKLKLLSFVEAAFLIATLPYLMRGQNRFADGELKGFTKSPTEHIINNYEGVVEARSFEGSVVDSTGAPMPGAIVEIRGPGTSERIKSTTADNRGQFRIGRLKKGTYAFKITLNGFQSVVGQVKIDSAKERKPAVRIVLKLGV